MGAVSSEYVVLRPMLDAWVPARPYSGGGALPVTWVSSIAERSDRGVSDVASETASGFSETATAHKPQATPAASMMTRAACPALLGGPLLLAPRPASARSASLKRPTSA